MKEMILNLALCKGRHEIVEAVDGAVFRKEVNPLNPTLLEESAFSSLWGKCHSKGFVTPDPTEEDGNAFCIARGVKLNLYVTGLSVALVAVLNVCRREGISVTLWHFDRENGKYYSQEVG